MLKDDTNDLPHLSNSVDHSTFKVNPNAEVGLHPLIQVDRYAPVPTPMEGALLFHETILSIHTLDYGDFMRQANFAIKRLQQALSRQEIPLTDVILQMKTYVQFSPSWDVESTKARLIKDTDELIILLRDISISKANSTF